jgi:hypothetical protein
MDYETRKVLEEWDRDVEAELRKLVHRGVPPYEAIERARKAVTRRRQVEHERGGK